MTDLADLIDRLDGINREGGLGQRKHEIIAEAVAALRAMAAENEQPRDNAKELQDILDEIEEYRE